MIYSFNTSKSFTPLPLSTAHVRSIFIKQVIIAKHITPKPLTHFDFDYSYAIPENKKTAIENTKQYETIRNGKALKMKFSHFQFIHNVSPCFSLFFVSMCHHRIKEEKKKKNRYERRTFKRLN